MRRSKLTKILIGRSLQVLRHREGMTLAQVAAQCEGLDVAALSLFEHGEQLRRLHRHAPNLARVLGNEVYRLAFDAITVLVEEDELGDFDQRVLQVLRDILQERVGSIEDEGPARGRSWDKRKWGPMPNIQELAERLRLVKPGEPIDLVEANRLSEAVQRLKLLRGWGSSDEE
jgi:transcriptional regulator with XRE-family HTH domain